MSDTAPEATQDGNQGGQTSTAPQFEAITSQEEFDKALSKRLDRERAKFSDYDELKAKAGQLDALSEASQTETEKATNRATKAERERDDARAESLRLRIAVQHGISLEDADLFLTGTDEETLSAQAKRLSDRAAASKPAGNTIRREGGNPRPATNNINEFVNGLFTPDR